MTLYLPTDEEALEGIGPWNDDTDVQPANLASFEQDRYARSCNLHGKALCLCANVTNGYDEHYTNLLREHGRSTYALLSGSIGSTYLRPWHGCIDHNHNHCPDCRTCDCIRGGK
jgi:hypothetical protein